MYITLYSVTETTCFIHIVSSCIVTMEEVLANITDNMCVKLLPKFMI